jgi:hypothetical protein
MKRKSLQTSVGIDTKQKLGEIARREKLTDRGVPSKGRAIDWLVNYYEHTRNRK